MKIQNENTKMKIQNEFCEINRERLKRKTKENIMAL